MIRIVIVLLYYSSKIVHAIFGRNAGVLKGLSTLHESGVKPRWVVIDDGWQHTTNDDALNGEQWDERLLGLEANKRFRYDRVV